MIRTVLSSLLLLGAPVAGFASEQLIPAGALLQCTVSEPKLSSKTEQIGDPVLCQVSHVELYGRATFPYGSYLVGHFEDYKDPGHFVGKGWMELKFDRLVVGNDTVVPISARVVEVPKYNVDKEGRIHGNGHPVRDTVEWLIPVLWPIDLINLPRRGPRPVLKPETRLTLKVLDDFGIPSKEDLRQQQQPALVYRDQAPVYQQPAPVYQQQPAPVIYQPAPVQQSYAPAPQPMIINNYIAPPQQAQPQYQQQPVIYNYPPPAPRPVAVPYPVPVPAPVAVPVAPYHYGYPPIAYRPGYYAPY